VFERIYQQLPDSQVPASLREVIESLKDEPSAGLLRSVYSKLISIAQTVKEINSTNDSLIKGSLRAIKSSIAFLVSCTSTSGGPCYENSGQIQSQSLIPPMIKEEA
jgi:flagellar biosynthesis/type III secretory pathway chaperone